MSSVRSGSHHRGSISNCVILVGTGRGGVGVEKEEGHSTVHLDGIYIQFATPTHQEMVLLGEVTIPVDHLFLEGSVLLKDATMIQVWMKCILTIQWRATLKGAANRPGMHPVTIPLPNTIEISKMTGGINAGGK